MVLDHRRCWLYPVLGVLLVSFVLGPVHARDEKEECLALYRKGEALLKQGRFQDAVEPYERAVELAPKAFGPKHRDTLNLQNNLAFLYHNLARYKDAEPLYRRVLAVREETLPANDPAIASVLNNLGEVARLSERFEQAESFYRRSLKIKESNNPTDPGVALTLNNLGLLYRAMGYYEKAEKEFLRSLKLFDKPHPSTAKVLDNLAELYCYLGRADKAAPLLQRCLKMFEDNLPADHPDLAICLNNHAFLQHRLLGQLNGAEPLYRRALAIQEKKLGRDHPNTAMTLNNLGVLYQDLGQYDRAEEFLTRCRDIRQGAGQNHPDLAQSLNDLGYLAQERGQPDKAESLFRASLASYEERLGKDHPEVAQILTNLAILLLLQGRDKDAEPLLRRSLTIREARLVSGHPDLAQSLGLLSLLHAAAERWDDTVAEVERSERIQRGYAARILSVLPEQDQLIFLNTRGRRDRDASLSIGLVCANGVDTAGASAGWALNLKGLAQQTLAERILLARAGSGEQAELAAALQGVRRRLAVLTVQSSKDANEQRRRLEQLLEKEKELSRSFAQATGQPVRDDPWIGLDEVRRQLPADAVLIEIARFAVRDYRARKVNQWWQEPRYVAWVIPPAGKGAVQVVDLGSASSIDASVTAVTAALQASNKAIRLKGEAEAETDLREPLEQLAKTVLHPLLPHAGKSPRWILSPDSNLWLVPWAALPLPNGKYFVEEHLLSHVVSGRDLVPGVRQGVKVTGPLVLADPDFDLGLAQVQVETRKLLRGQELSGETRGLSKSLKLGEVPRLPGTAAEAEAIAPKLRQYAGTEPGIHTDRQALVGFVQAVRNPRVLVLSTHGFFLAEETVAAKERERLDGFNQERRLRGLENPLLRCGLLLAGCNNAKEAKEGDDNGVLTGVQIVGADLRGCELVVLSACDTGLGDVRNGEGVAGLRQAFQLAGAESVIATLWQVPDQQSAQLMIRFFDNLATKQNKAEALRNAQLEVIKKRRDKNAAAHPFYWAAFTLTGRAE